MFDLNNPEGRLVAAESLGPDEYNAAMSQHIADTTIMTINGHSIRSVYGGRHGCLYSIGDPVSVAFKTIDEAKAYAQNLKPELFIFTISLTCQDIETTDAASAAEAFREFCLEADQHPMMFKVRRQHDGQETYVKLDPKPAPQASDGLISRLSSYISPDDVSLTNEQFLEIVADRIRDDLALDVGLVLAAKCRMTE